MNATQQELARLTNRATRYEVAAQGSRVLLVGYTSHKSGDGLRDLLTERLDSGARRIDLLDLATGVDPQAWVWLPRRSAGCHARDAEGAEWIVRFTGRTQRDAILAGKIRHTIYDEEHER